MAPIDFAYKYYAVCIPPKQQTLCNFLYFFEGNHV